MTEISPTAECVPIADGRRAQRGQSPVFEQRHGGGGGGRGCQEGRRRQRRRRRRRDQGHVDQAVLLLLVLLLQLLMVSDHKPYYAYLPLGSGLGRIAPLPPYLFALFQSISLFSFPTQDTSEMVSGIACFNPIAQTMPKWTKCHTHTF